ncbi:MAG: ATP-binding protein [Polaromonas sp.]
MKVKFPRVAGWASQRTSLWLLLLVLVVALLGLLIWLAGRYEASLVQSRLDHNAAEAVTDIRSGLNRNIQGFQAFQTLNAREPSLQSWTLPARQMLHENREILRLEWRNPTLDVLGFVETPFRSSVFERLDRDGLQADVNLTCTNARRMSGAAYSASYFLPQSDGLGLEVLDMCLPVVVGGRLTGYTVATYSLQNILSELVGKPFSRGVGLSFTEADGTRLALQGTPSRGSRVFVAQQLLDLPGSTMVVRMESRLGTPALFPNVLTALVAAMSLALLVVLFLLGRDMRRRLQVEHDLGEALAFRKAMENSLLTGLRARDLHGRITYVNPAFCQMVGVDAQDLLNQSMPSPYWPPELAGVYQRRQEMRLAGNHLPREGHESVFMRKDGTRFPVLIMEAPLINAVGKHTGWMSAILDVSEQRRTEELSRASQDRLQASARLAMVGEMASLLSHELNQPLAAISSYATGSLNLLHDQAQAGGDHAPAASPLLDDLQLAMRRIAEQAERAGKVIKSVHDFVRRSERVREVVQPRALLDAIMPLVILQARKLGVRVATLVDDACPAVLCDRTMVEQVLLNLARNGMQAMQGGNDASPLAAASVKAPEKVLTLRIRPAAANAQSQWVEFAVMDQGEGISGEVAKQLFTPFFTTRQEGMGLGLSLCRTVIEQHGGFLGYESVQPQGTIFSFTLPVAAACKGGATAQGALQES